MSDYMHELDMRAKRSLDRAQREYDAMQPPEFYEVTPECPTCGMELDRHCNDWVCPDCGTVDLDEVQSYEDYREQEADRKRDDER